MGVEQRYKVYLNDTAIFLGSPQSITSVGVVPAKDVCLVPYSGEKKQIEHYVDELERGAEIKVLAFHGENVERLWADFQGCFSPVKAAGGLVTCADGRLLVMLRRGRWDLPKGKIDVGESPPQAALREVQEETGLKIVHLGPFVGHTWHLYRQASTRFLKCTWWFRMSTPDIHTTPQREEDIEEIRWVAPLAWLAERPNVYPNIREIILQVFAR